MILLVTQPIQKNIIITSQILDNKILVKKLLLFSDFESLIEFFSKSSPILCGCDFPFNFPLDYQKEFGLKNFNDTKKLIAKFNKKNSKILYVKSKSIESMGLNIHID